MAEEKRSRKIEKKINGVLMGAIIGGAIGSVIGMKMKPSKEEKKKEQEKKGKTLLRKLIPALKKVRKQKAIPREEVILPEEEIKKIPHE